jgi:hypothetical protein
MFRTASHAVYDDGITASRHKAEIISADCTHVYAQIARAVIVHAKTAIILRICFVPAIEKNHLLDVPDDNPLPGHVILANLTKRKPSALLESLGINPCFINDALNPDSAAVQFH